MSKYILSEKQNIQISKVIRYLKKFNGCPYKKYCSNKGQTKDAAPFWVENKPPPKFDIIHRIEISDNCPPMQLQQLLQIQSLNELWDSLPN